MKFPSLVKYMAAGFAFLAVLLVLFVNNSLAGLVEWAAPGGGLWTHLLLLAVEGVALVWFWKGLFGRHAHLLLPDQATEEERAAFARELGRRLGADPVLRARGIDPADPEQLAVCLEHLNSRADLEIRQSAKKIFLATALSQNGRIDALIVFVSLCRLVWRISSIYNQRPHPREIMSLYWAVVTSTFLALSIEELDLSTEITVGFGEAFQAMAPAGMAAGIPFAGRALQTFTASTIDGAANCYLALRAGIITRNIYAYGGRGQAVPGRTAVFREAGAVLLGMSRELVEKVAGAVVRGFAGAARTARTGTLRAGEGLVDGVSRAGQETVRHAGRAASETARLAGALAAGTADVAQHTGKSIVHAGKKSGETVARAGQETARCAGRAASETVRLAGALAAGTADVAQHTGKGILHVGKKTGETVARTGRSTVRCAGRATMDTARFAGTLASGALDMTQSAGKGLANAGKTSTAALGRATWKVLKKSAAPFIGRRS